MGEPSVEKQLFALILVSMPIDVSKVESDKIK